MTTQLDLRQLAYERDAPPKIQKPSRGLVARYLFPGVIVCGFVALLAWAARDRFLTSKPVTVVPVVVSRAEVQQSGTPLFQAAGWIEPRPTRVLVSALADGVLDELLVVEGQDVRALEPVARLIDTETQFAVEQAQATLALRQAELASANAELTAARLRLERPVHLDAARADADSLLAKAETELAKVPFQIQSAKARLDYAQQNLEGKRSVESTLAGRVIQQAQSEFDGARADLKEFEQRGAHLKREIDALRRKYDALSEQRKLLIDETRHVADTTAKTQAAGARVRQSEIDLKQSQLQLQRMVVRAPVAGRVLEVMARRGMRVSSTSGGSLHGSNTVVSLYDPQQLQVRADVRLEDFPLVQPGQKVEIQTVSVKETLHGTVLLATSSANIQKNTLEVKVAIDSPPAGIRPEMLVTATFLAPEQPAGSDSKNQQRLLIPRALVESVGNASAVWVADAGSNARQKTVKLGKAGTGPLVEIIEGLSPTDKLISGGREGLRDGDRINITGEDS